MRNGGVLPRADVDAARNTPPGALDPKFDRFLGALRAAKPEWDIIPLTRHSAAVCDPTQGWRTMGSVSYDDLRQRSYTDPRKDTFNVYAPSIRNGRYADYNTDYHSRSTTSMERAVQTAVSHIRPVPFSVLVAEAGRVVNEMARDYCHQVQADHADTLRALIGVVATNPTLDTFLGWVISQRHSMVGPLCEAAGAYASAAAALDQLQAAPPALWFVKYDAGSGVYWAQEYRLKVNKNSVSTRTVDGDPTLATSGSGSFIDDRAAVLAITKEGQHVHGVGARLGENVWIMYE